MRRLRGYKLETQRRERLRLLSFLEAEVFQNLVDRQIRAAVFLEGRLEICPLLRREDGFPAVDLDHLSEEVSAGLSANGLQGTSRTFM